MTRIINSQKVLYVFFCVLLFPALAQADTLGKSTVGNQTDTSNSNWINASRFVTGAVSGIVTSMSVNVGSVAASPNNQFQVAIYSDSNNSPSNLIAKSASGTLIANSWQTIAIKATLTPNTVYWLAYNTNGTSPSLNNMRYSGNGTSAWTSGQVAFNTWPTSFGASVKAAVTFSIYATYTPESSTAPTINLTAPANGATVSGSQTVTANATNAAGVQFKLDGVNLGAEDTTNPYSVSWNTTSTSNGVHTLSAVARNNAGVTATSSVSVTVNNAMPAPTVTLTAPTNGATVSGSQTVNANATNAAGVQFKLDGVNLGAEDTTSSYSVSWNTINTSNGAHTLSAVARNSAGVTATSSVSVTVNNILMDQPILLITDPANPYTKYYEEILNTEGIKSYNTFPLNQVDSALLNNYDLVILAEMVLNDSQVTLLSNWVNTGGKLIAMRPDKKLSTLLGLTVDPTSLSNAYLKIDTSIKPGFGIVGETIQYHGVADLYTLNGANAVAMLYSNATTATSNPAVTMHTVGANDGQAAAFTFDLVRSIIQTRQGNAAWSEQQRDGIDGYEASEMFVGINGQPDWNNLDKAIIPIADEQQRLLANLITEMEKTNLPLPRLWYLPRNLKAAIVMTGDSEGAGGTAGRFNNYLSQSKSGCNVVNWECVRSSSYIFSYENITNAQVISFSNQGFEVGLHVNTGCGPWGSPAQLAEFYSSQMANIKTVFPGLPAPASARTHCVEWDDWASQPKTKLINGIRLDTDYYYYPASFVKGRPGYFNGAGMPMRFADLDGSIIDVFQATTQITDESGLDVNFAINTMLDKALGPEGYFAVITANMHTTSANSAGSDMIVAAAQARNVPIVSGRQMLKWLDDRDTSGIEAVSWSASVLSFVVTGGGNGLTAMAPMNGIGSILSSINQSGGAPVTFSTQTVKGIPYALFSVTPGTYFVSYTPDTNAPFIQSTQPSNGAINVSTNTSIKFTANEALDVATVNSTNVELRDAAGNLVAATISYDGNTNSATLTPNTTLQTNTAYTALAKTGLKDLAGNALASESRVLFTTAAQVASIVVGNNDIGGLTDTYDSNWINGSRFVNGAQLNNITRMSVYIRAIDNAPNNKYQMAIYADNNGSPGALIASTTQGTLNANAWNTLPVSASLQPNTAYWFVYNTNGTNANVNNMAYQAGNIGQGIYGNVGVGFGAWPTNFGAGIASSAVFSIYAQ